MPFQLFPMQNIPSVLRVAREMKPLLIRPRSTLKTFENIWDEKSVYSHQKEKKKNGRFFKQNL